MSRPADAATEAREALVAAAEEGGIVFAFSHDSKGKPMDTVKLLGDGDAVRAVILLREERDRYHDALIAVRESAVATDDAQRIAEKALAHVE